MTSAVRDKFTDTFDVLVLKDTNNKLFQNSRARIRQLKAISVKKIGTKLGSITDATLKSDIDNNVKRMLGLA